MNNKLNQIKINYIENNSIKENKINLLKNEIICIYKKKGNEISLLHDYNINIEEWDEKCKKSYIEGKNNINEKNIEIYINNKRIKFDYKYKSNKRGEIKVKFKFKKFLTSTTYMFSGCSSLQLIDLSSFNTTKLII